MLAILFGDAEGQRIIDAVVPQQTATETSVSLTPGGELACASWKETHPSKTMLGWAHSHHVMTAVPSVIDIQQQWRYQRESPGFVMLIFNIADGMRAMRLSEEAMAGLSSCDGVVQEGTDTTSLVEDVPVSEFQSRLEVWFDEDLDPRKQLCVTMEEHAKLKHRVRALEYACKEQAKVIEDLQGKLQELGDMPVRPRKVARPSAETASVSAESSHASLPMPPSAFALFMRSLKGELSGSAAQRSKQASQRWQALDEVEKNVFRSAADEKRVSYQQSKAN